MGAIAFQAGSRAEGSRAGGPRAGLLGKLVLVLLACLLASAATAEIYRWVDDEGVPHFSDRVEEVPPAYRSQLHDVSEEIDQERRFTLFGGSQEAAPEARAEAEPAPSIDPEAWGDLQQTLEQGDFSAAVGSLGAGMLVAFLLSVGVAILIVTAFGALILILALRICREESPGFAKASGVVALQIVAGVAASVVVALAVGIGEAGAGEGAAQFGLSTVVNAGVLRGLLIESFGKAVLVSLVVTVVGFLVGVSLVFAALCAGGTAALL